MKNKRAFDGLDLTGLGLEIGAGHSPIASDPRLRVEHLDREARQSLIEKFGSQGIDTSRVPHIDYIWSGEPYQALVGEKRFDWIIASHVIEHVPDPIGFIGECASILAHRGVLLLVVPDKRFCFDYYRPSSGLARLVDAHLRRDQSTTLGALVEHIAFASAVDGRITWDGANEMRPAFVHTITQARELLHSSEINPASFDIHAWAFTSASFRLLIEDCYQLGLISLRESRWCETTGFEFSMQLAHDGGGPRLNRVALAAAARAAE